MGLLKRLFALASFSNADVDAAGVLVEEDLRVNHPQIENKEEIKIRFLKGFQYGLKAAKSIKGDLLVNKSGVLEQLQRLRWTVDFVSEVTILASVENEPEVFGRAIGFLYASVKYKKSVTAAMEPGLGNALNLLKKEKNKKKYFEFIITRVEKLDPITGEMIKKYNL